MAGTTHEVADMPIERVDEFTFAAGQDGQRMSTTWMVRWNTRLRRDTKAPTIEMFIFNVDAGSAVGKLSFHGANDNDERERVHYKIATVEPPTMFGLWDWPGSVPGSNGRLFRLATVVLTSASIESQPPGPRSQREPILLEPPPPGKQIEVDIFLALGPGRAEDWPGRRTMGTEYVTHRTVALHHEDGDVGAIVGRWIIVARLADLMRFFTDPQGFPADDAVAEFASRTTSPRILVHNLRIVDGQHVHMLAEMPIAQVTSEAHPA